jgi:hypothetical protein
MRHLFDELLENFIEKLSLKDEEKKRILLRPGPVNFTACFNQTLPTFTENCVGSRVSQNIPPETRTYRFRPELFMMDCY